MVLRFYDRDALFTKACRITVENGQARMAWIGMVDPETKAVNVQACAGITADYLTSITDTAKGSIMDKEPVGRAIITGSPVICNDVAHDPMIAPWRDKALECQYHSIAAIPIQLSGNTIGSFAIYSEVVNFFDDNTAKLLSNIAADLSFALDYINKEEERRKTETSLRESEQKFRNLVEESLVGVYIIQDNRFKYCNPRILDIFGYTEKEILEMPVINTIAEF
jgi:PAS domain-containing protein